jgi:hypothetical protein|tara:strand:+ start:3296 stop:3868 length:573 start_codon:yes stop_codon:yes gene_type:complete
MKKTFEISIPTEWEDVSIEKFVKYSQAVNHLEDDKEIVVKTISTLCSIAEEVVEVMKMKDLQKIQTTLQKLISKPINKEIINKINIEGTVYGFHPKLDEMTMGEFVDVETYAKENDFAGMMSVLYRPIIQTQGNRYNIEPYDTDVHYSNSQKFKKLSINVGNAIAVFFWDLGKTQLQHFQQYSKKVEKEV